MEHATSNGPGDMPPMFSELAAEIAAATDATRPEIVSGIVNRIRQLGAAEQSSLVQAAMIEHRASANLGTDWEPRRTLVGVILHAVRIPEIETADQHQLRTEIDSDLAKLNGDPNAYRALNWIQADEALARHGSARNDSTRG